MAHAATFPYIWLHKPRAVLVSSNELYQTRAWGPATNQALEQRQYNFFNSSYLSICQTHRGTRDRLASVPLSKPRIEDQDQRANSIVVTLSRGEHLCTDAEIHREPAHCSRVAFDGNDLFHDNAAHNRGCAAAVYATNSCLCRQNFCTAEI